MAGDPEHQARNPQLQPEAHGGGQRAVGDRHRARRAAEQDGLCQRTVKRNLKALHLEPRSDPLRAHASTAPPENEKNDRKNEDAAKAIDNPKTIWISLRNP